VGHVGAVRSTAFSPDGKNLVSGSDDGTIKVWTMDRGTLHRSLEGHEYAVRSMALSPDGNRLVSGSVDGFIKVWDLASGVSVHTIDGHYGAVESLVFSPDGQRFASAGGDRQIKMWQTESGTRLYGIWTHFSTINSLSFSPDGRYLASGSEDTTIKIWEGKSKKLFATFQAINGEDYISYTKDGFFDASPGAAMYITYRVGDEVYSLEQYEQRYRRPDIIAHLFGQKLGPKEKETASLAMVDVPSKEPAEKVGAVSAKDEPSGELAMAKDTVTSESEEDIPLPEKDRSLQQYIQTFFSEILREMKSKPVGIIAFSGFSAQGGQELELSARIGEKLMSELSAMDNLSVIERSKVIAVSEKRKLPLSDLKDTGVAISIGKALEAQYIFTGWVITISNSITIFGRIINVETGKIESVSQIVVPKGDDMDALLMLD